MIKNIIFGLIALVFINWIFNKSALNKLEKRYDKALKEHKKLLIDDSLNQVKLDSLTIVFNELNN